MCTLYSIARAYVSFSNFSTYYFQNLKFSITIPFLSKVQSKVHLKIIKIRQIVPFYRNEIRLIDKNLYKI